MGSQPGFIRLHALLICKGLGPTAATKGKGSLTQLLGRARECALDHFAVGVVPSTHATLVLLLAGADHPVTAHLLQGGRGGAVYK